MAVYKEEKTNTWRAVYRYTDWNGERKQTQKRGFKTKREAQAWEREQLNKTSADLDMTFRSFVDLYTADMKTRLKENTWATKDHIVRTKLLPYFGRLKMCNITAQQIITWQNEMLNHKDENGKPYSPVYLKTVHNQLSAIFNHAVRYYNLRENPCKKAGSMGKKKNREMMFWTKEQYLKFAEVMMDKGAIKMSAKNLDKHNRWRNKTVAFRVSPEEDAQIETAVKLTGLTKQDYIIRRLLCRDVVVQGNPRVYKALRDQLAAVLDELRRIEAGQGVNDELLDTIQMIATIMNGMQEDFAYDR